MKKAFFLSLVTSCLAVQSLFAITTAGVFKKYPNPCFVETGSFRGQGIDNALKAGFSQVYSIELAPHYYTFCKKKFSNRRNVHLFLGDSSAVLARVIASIDKPITFWLDGHCSNGDTARGETMTPLMKELEAIKLHPIKTHTILIDDVRCFGTKEFDFLTQQAVLLKLKEINPKYTIVYEDGYKKKDVLVAYIK